MMRQGFVLHNSKGQKDELYLVVHGEKFTCDCCNEPFEYGENVLRFRMINSKKCSIKCVHPKKECVEPLKAASKFFKWKDCANFHYVEDVPSETELYIDPAPELKASINAPSLFQVAIGNEGIKADTNNVKVVDKTKCFGKPGYSWEGAQIGARVVDDGKDRPLLESEAAAMLGYHDQLEIKPGRPRK